MIEAREVLRKLRFSQQDEAEVQRIGSEISAVLSDPGYDGTPCRYEMPVGESADQQARAYRIACALQRRFQAKAWAVFFEPFVDSQNPELMTKVHRLSLMIDAAACAKPNGVAVGPNGTPPALPATAVSVLPTAPTLSIIFGTYNRLVHLKQAIESVRKNVGDLSYEIVVTDGGSTDGSRAWLAAQPDVVMLGEHRLEGAVKAFNQAYTLSRGEFVCNLNDDAIVSKGRRLAEAVEFLKTNEDTGQVALGISSAENGFNEIYPGKIYANFGVVRRSVADAVAYIQGGFWNPVYKTYAADCEFSAWVWRLGYKVAALPHLVIEDVLVDDELRQKNGGGAVAGANAVGEAKLMYTRWPVESFAFDGPEPHISMEEAERYRAVRDRAWHPEVAPKTPDTLVTMAGLCGFPEPEEERRLRKLAPLVRALDPVEGQFPQRAMKLEAERILHVHINGVDSPDQQAGLVRGLERWALESIVGVVAGHNIDVSNFYQQVRWTDLATPGDRERVILEVAKQLKPTLVFMQLQAPDVIDLRTVQVLRTLFPEAVLSTWNGDIASCNSPWHTNWQVAMGRLVDLTLHSSMSHVHSFRAAGIHTAGYLQIGYDQEQYRPPLRAPHNVEMTAIGPMMTGDDAIAVSYGDWRAKSRSYDVAFLGSRYGGEDEFSKSTRWNDGALRDEIVIKMKEAFGWKFCLYGNGWAVNGKRDQVMPLKKAHEVYQRSKIGLSISLMNDLECYSSDRLFRILGCGALALVKRFPGMSVLGLEDGVNCLVFDTVAEAVEKAKLAVTAECDPIRKAGAELARTHHTWGVRMLELQCYVNAVRKS